MSSNPSTPQTSILKLKSPEKPASYANEVWITDKAWISGVAGALMVVICGFWYYKADILSKGLSIAGWQLSTTRDESVVCAIIIIGLTMVGVELIRLCWRAPSNFIQRSPLIIEKRYSEFFKEGILAYLQNLILLRLAIAIYDIAPQHGTWNFLLDIIWVLYLLLGLPYIFLTRAFKYDPKSDLTDYPNLVTKCFWALLSRLPQFADRKPEFGSNEKKAFLGLVIKLYFTPLMTIFFFNQFPSMVNYIAYLNNELPNLLTNNNYSHAQFNRDFYNVIKSFLLSIDVALAWCGYIVTSRWLDNQTQSAEPTLSGWVVCMLSYPPFQIIGLYFAYPSDSAIFNYSNLWAISFFVFLAICCYTIYMSVTLFFGVRFSNLTHRGIIRTGPFAIVRHPAYASKNISWWCVILPAIIMNIENTGYVKAAAFIIGISMQTWIYYMRAITEERHLSADPKYREYCQQVKYRFIPGII